MFHNMSILDLDITKVVLLLRVFVFRLVSGGIPVGHFNYVFVDEAGQAVEPECVIAIAGKH